MSVFVFPGQGSQRVGMGKELFVRYPEYVKQADDILGYSIEELCLQDPNRQLGKTNFTQPALYIVSALSFLQQLDDGGARPDFVAGHSLGEYNALFAAGVYSFTDGLKLVQKRGHLMSEASEGAMAAVVNLTEVQIADVLAKHHIDSIDIANFNSPSQIVIAGPRKDIIAAAPFFDEAGARYVPLNVSAPFHSRYMQPVVEDFTQFLTTFDLQVPSIPVIANVDARPYRVGEIKNNLALQIKSPVKWVETIRYLMGRGASEFIEVGPGNVLSKLNKQIQAQTSPLVVEPIVEESIVEESIVEEPIVEEPIVEEPIAEPAPVVTNNVVEQSPVAEPITPTRSVTVPAKKSLQAENLGSEAFRRAYGVRYAYMAGAMANGIASTDLVSRMSQAGLLSFLGTGGLPMADIEQSLLRLQQALVGKPYGVNIPCSLTVPEREMQLVELLLNYRVPVVEASGFPQITPALVRYRLAGLGRDAHGQPTVGNKLVAKISRPEVAEAFMSPPPQWIVNNLLQHNLISQQQADMACGILMADDICIEADSAGNTSQAVMTTLLPSILHLRDEMARQNQTVAQIRVGAGGGIGTPEAAAAAFMLGADFVLTGSINQCTVEAGTSELVKDMLNDMEVQDTTYAPAADLFELGAKVQVLSRGVFFPTRANKLFEIWKQFDSLEAIDAKSRQQIEEKFFKCSIEQAYEQTRQYFAQLAPEELSKAEKNAKHKMALVFKWYFSVSLKQARQGSTVEKVNFQIHCGSALGAFNQWVKNTELQRWQQRHVDRVAEILMNATAEYIDRRIAQF